MEIAIHPKLREFIQEQLTAGHFDSVDDLVNTAVARLRVETEFPPEADEDLKREVTLGVEQADRGEFAEFTAEDIIREGRAILSRKQKAV